MLQQYKVQNQQNQLNAKLSLNTKYNKWSISFRRFYSWNLRLRFQILSRIWSASGTAVRTATIASIDHWTTLPAQDRRVVGGRSPIRTCVHIGIARTVISRTRFRDIPSPIRSSSSRQQTTSECRMRQEKASCHAPVAVLLPVPCRRHRYEEQILYPNPVDEQRRRM